jgi:Flp pilus assembly protein TadG
MSKHTFRTGKRRSPPSRRRGAALVEFVVCLPIFVLLVMATIEACEMIYLQQSLNIAAYEGTRVALVPGSESSNVQAACDELLKYRGVKKATVTITPKKFSTAAYGTYIAVTVTASCDQNNVFPWFFTGRTLTGRVEMMKEY